MLCINLKQHILCEKNCNFAKYYMHQANQIFSSSKFKNIFKFDHFLNIKILVKCRTLSLWNLIDFKYWGRTCVGFSDSPKSRLFETIGLSVAMCFL